MWHKPVYFIAGHSGMAVWNQRDLSDFWAKTTYIVCVYYTWNKHHFYQPNKFHRVYFCMCYAFCGWFNDCLWTIMLNCCHNPVIVARKWAAVHWLHRRAERQDERFLQKQVFLTFWRGEVWSCHTVWGSYSFIYMFPLYKCFKDLKRFETTKIREILKIC